jgi:hypothetical protein
MPPCVVPLPRMGGRPSSSPVVHRWLLLASCSATEVITPCSSSTHWMEQPRLAALSPASAQHRLLCTTPPPSPASLLHLGSMTPATVSTSCSCRGTRRCLPPCHADEARERHVLEREYVDFHTTEGVTHFALQDRGVCLRSKSVFTMCKIH